MAENQSASQSKKVAVLKTRPAQLALLLIASFVLGFAGGLAGSRIDLGLTDQDTEQAKQVVTEQSQLISSIADTVGPSVVSVNVVSQTTQQDPFFGPQSVEQQSAGTGFIISEDGYVVTNRHVIPSSARNVSLTMADGTELTDVEVVGRTSNSDPLDIAFLKINDAKGKELKPVIIGDSSKMEVGDMVVAIGNALGQFQNTVTSGILSGYGRDVVASGAEGGEESLQNLFQTDAAINQGNSGGPLVNANGEVVAVNTAVAGNAENIGFAIPINDVKGLIKSVLNDGKVERPYLGVRYVMLTDDLAYQYNLDTKRGAYIVPPSRGSGPSIVPDSPAAKAGLQEKDIITKVNDTVLDERTSLSSALGQHGVGETVTLTIIRGGQEQTVQATLEASPEN